jgi:hypothetical protein
MKLLTILALLLASATPANAANLRGWDCADGIKIGYEYTAAHKTEDKRESFGFDIGGYREFFKTVNGRATVVFKIDKKTGYHEAIYLNGKRCHETTGTTRPKVDPADELTANANATRWQIERLRRNQGVPKEAMPALLELREAITKAEQQPVEPVELKSHFPPGWLEHLNQMGRQQRQKN